MPIQILLQGYGGLFLFALLCWQLATGLRWIKLGRKHYFYHRISGITIFTLGIPHMINGLLIIGFIRL